MGNKASLAARQLSIKAQPQSLGNPPVSRTRERAAMPKQPPEAVPHEEQAWEWFRAMGSPKYWVSRRTSLQVQPNSLSQSQPCRQHMQLAIDKP